MIDYENEYRELIEVVNKINKDASYYMEYEARDLEGFAPCFDLMCCFYWVDTPQGHEYWSEIHQKVQELLK